MNKPIRAAIIIPAENENIRLELDEIKISFASHLRGDVIFSEFVVQMGMGLFPEEVFRLKGFCPDVVFTCGLHAARIMLMLSKKADTRFKVISLFLSRPVGSGLMRSTSHKGNRVTAICTKTFLPALTLDVCFILSPQARFGLIFYQENSLFAQSDFVRIKNEYENRADGRCVSLVEVGQISAFDLESLIVQHDFVYIPRSYFPEKLKDEIARIATDKGIPFYSFYAGVPHLESVLGRSVEKTCYKDLHELIALTASAMVYTKLQPGDVPTVIFQASLYLYIDSIKAQSVGVLHFEEIRRFVKYYSLWGKKRDDLSEIFWHAKAFLRGGSDEQLSRKFFAEEADLLERKIEARFLLEQEKFEKRRSHLSSLHRKAVGPQKIAIVSYGKGVAYKAMEQGLYEQLDVRGEKHLLDFVPMQPKSMGDSDIDDLLSHCVANGFSAIYVMNFRIAYRMRIYLSQHRRQISIVFGGVSKRDMNKLVKRPSFSGNSLVGCVIDRNMRLIHPDEVLYGSPSARKMLILTSGIVVDGFTQNKIDVIADYLKSKRSGLEVDTFVCKSVKDFLQSKSKISDYDAVVVPEGCINTESARLLSNVCDGLGVDLYGAGDPNEIVSDWGVYEDYKFTGKENANQLCEIVIHGKKPQECRTLIARATSCFTGQRVRTAIPFGVISPDSFLHVPCSTRIVSHKEKLCS